MTRAALASPARQNAKDFLESQGVEFPPGASANFIPGSSRLVVRNTAPNLDLIESLVDAAMGEQPTQVEIEAKFVEVTPKQPQRAWFRLDAWSVFDRRHRRLWRGRKPGADGRAYPVRVSGHVGSGWCQYCDQGLRTGSGTQPYSALSVNSINALLARSLGLGTDGRSDARHFLDCRSFHQPPVPSRYSCT